MTVESLKIKWQREHDLYKGLNDQIAGTIQRFISDINKIHVQKPAKQYTIFGGKNEPSN